MKILKDLFLAAVSLIAMIIGWGLILIILGVSARVIVWAYNLL